MLVTRTLGESVSPTYSLVEGCTAYICTNTRQVRQVAVVDENPRLLCPQRSFWKLPSSHGGCSDECSPLPPESDGELDGEHDDEYKVMFYRRDHKAAILTELGSKAANISVRRQGP